MLYIGVPWRGFGLLPQVSGCLPRRGAGATPAVRLVAVVFISAASCGALAEEARADFAAYPYTHNTSCQSRVDPITFVWYGRSARYSESANHTAYHTRWYNREGSNQTFSSHGYCRTQHFQAADACGICSRFHTRGGETIHQDTKGRWETLLTPHHEDTRTWGYWCHAVDANGSKGSGFDKGRARLVDRVRYTHHYYGDYAYWGNTATKKQCDGDRAGSNGWVPWFAINESGRH